MLGLIFKRIDMPLVPVVLGMVLGGIMEGKFRNAMARVETPIDFVTRPAAAIIAATIVFVVALHFYGMWKGWKEKRRGTP